MNAAMPDLRICTSESLCAEYAGRRLVSGAPEPENEDEEKALNEMDT